MSIGKHSDMN